MSALQPLLRTSDLAEVFGVTKATICRWRSDGRLRAIRVGRELRFRRDDIERVLDGSTRSSPREGLREAG
jgi:excisionase family DNA binding protein